jgi:hypothetical protein
MIFFLAGFSHGFVTIAQATIMQIFNTLNTTVGYAVAHFVEALLYKPEGLGFDS